MKAIDALKLAGIAFAGVAAYLVVTKTVKAGGDTIAAASQAVTQVITKDLNPASTENIVYKSLPDTIQEKIGDALGFVFDHENYVKYKAATTNGGHSNTKTQNITALAPTSAGAGASTKEFAAVDPRRVDNPSYVNPFASIQTETIGYSPLSIFDQTQRGDK